MQIKSVSRTALEFLRKEIITGGLEPGQKLNEIELSSRLEISRHPLREAFRILEKEGLVESIPRRGAMSRRYLRKISKICPRQERYWRSMRSRSSRDTDKIDLSKIKGAIESAEKVNVDFDYDVDRYLDCHRIVENFHFQLIVATNNAWVIHFYKSFYSCISRYQFLCLRAKGVIEDSIEEHRNIYEAIMANDYEKARTMLRSHIYKQRC